MLEKLPDAVGHALESVRPGPGKAVFNAPAFASAPATIQVSSAAFEEGGTLPIRFTDDGTGTSPPLAWTQIPANTGAVVLLIEDIDCPAPMPLVHTIAWNLPGHDGGLPEGGLPSKASPGDGGIAMGRNSFLKAGVSCAGPAARPRPAPLLLSSFCCAGAARAGRASRPACP